MCACMHVCVHTLTWSYLREPLQLHLRLRIGGGDGADRWPEARHLRPAKEDKGRTQLQKISLPPPPNNLLFIRDNHNRNPRKVHRLFRVQVGFNCSRFVLSALRGGEIGGSCRKLSPVRPRPRRMYYNTL